jgi:large subunit ribosomal protein L21
MLFGGESVFGLEAKGGSMFAVVRSGGKQYTVAPNELVRVDRMAGQPGDKIELTDVLLVGNRDQVTVGAGKSVKAEIVEQDRNDTIIVFKKTRRHTYRRRNGHRQQMTVLRILEIAA